MPSTDPESEEHGVKEAEVLKTTPLPGTELQQKGSAETAAGPFYSLGAPMSRHTEATHGSTEKGSEPHLPLQVATGSPQGAQRTAHTSRMQKRARQVGQGTRLASQVSGRCGSWRLANHLPMQVRHHMGRQ